MLLSGIQNKMKRTTPVDLILENRGIIFMDRFTWGTWPLACEILFQNQHFVGETSKRKLRCRATWSYIITVCLWIWYSLGAARQRIFWVKISCGTGAHSKFINSERCLPAVRPQICINKTLNLVYRKLDDTERMRVTELAANGQSLNRKCTNARIFIASDRWFGSSTRLFYACEYCADERTRMPCRTCKYARAADLYRSPHPLCQYLFIENKWVWYPFRANDVLTSAYNYLLRWVIAFLR